MRIRNTNYSFGDLASIIGLFIVLVSHIFHTTITPVYTYTKDSESILNQLQTNSKVVDKLKSLIGQEYYSEQRFKSNIDRLTQNSSTQKTIDGKLLNLIFESSDRYLSIKEYINAWESVFTAIAFCVFAFFIYSVTTRNSAFQIEVEKLKKEAEGFKEKCEGKETKNKELSNKNKQLLLQNEKDEEYKRHLSMCNVADAFRTLKKSKWSISKIRENVRDLHEFHMIAIFAEKWLGVKDNLPKFVEFMDLYKNSDYRRPEKDKLLFLLSNPLNDSVREKLIKSDTNINDETIDDCFNNYTELYKIYHQYDNLFECRIMDEFPIFRYRRINGKILVADYSLRVDAHGDHRPHLLLKNEDSFECDGEQIPANQFYDAFTKYFKECWESAQSFPKYMNNNKK